LPCQREERNFVIGGYTYRHALLAAHGGEQGRRKIVSGAKRDVAGLGGARVDFD
jgi:hypothetical protein